MILWVALSYQVILFCKCELILEDGIGQQQVVDGRLVDSSVSDLMADEVEPCSKQDSATSLETAS